MFHIHEMVDLFLHFSALTVIALNYESVAVKRVAAVAAGHYVMLSTTVINAAFMRHFPTAWLFEHAPLGLLFISLFIYLMALTVFPLFKHIKKTEVNLNKLWFPLIIFPIAHTAIELFHTINLPAVFVSVNVFSTLGFILIFFFLYNIISKVFEDALQSALHAQEREYYFSQCKLMQESVDKMKAYRHDVKLHLAALKEFTADNEAAAEYLNTLLGDIEESEVYSDTGNIAFDSIINFKLKDVLRDNIDLSVKIFLPPELNIEVADVVTILGNLLDNAFEAVAKVADKRIKLTIEANKGNLFIKLDNSFDGAVNYAPGQNGAEPVILSRKEGGNHGYGLRNIQKSVEKYNGQMDITHGDNLFSVVILLYVDGK
ncbi:MAG: GHKL domain-containing protein [Oscillospiraceae bacterium]|nr:GHKL domain-containing protein [Oscillospiraceae bacterium]